MYIINFAWGDKWGFPLSKKRGWVVFVDLNFRMCRVMRPIT
jgi:hypothetical protein